MTEHMSRPGSGGVLTSFVQQTRDTTTFSVLLEKLRVERALTPAAVYNGAWIDRRLYSKIMGERNYHPAKDTVLALGLSLKLSLDEMRTLLESAGFSLSRSIVTDLVIMFCLERGIHDLWEVNALLEEAGQRALGGR